MNSSKIHVQTHTNIYTHLQQNHESTNNNVQRSLIKQQQTTTTILFLLKKIKMNITICVDLIARVTSMDSSDDAGFGQSPKLNQIFGTSFRHLDVLFCVRTKTIGVNVCLVLFSQCCYDYGGASVNWPSVNWHILISCIFDRNPKIK